MNTPDMKRYKSSEWNFALDIPKRWNSFPPVCTNSPAEVIRFASREDGTHLLIIFRFPHDPKQSLKELSDHVQQILAGKGFGNFASSETTIGSRAVLVLDFDKPKVDGIDGFWNCREYFITDGTLRFTLGFGTTNKAGMFDLYDRMAKSFEIIPEWWTVGPTNRRRQRGMALSVPLRGSRHLAPRAWAPDVRPLAPWTTKFHVHPAGREFHDGGFSRRRAFTCVAINGFTRLSLAGGQVLDVKESTNHVDHLVREASDSWWCCGGPHAKRAKNAKGQKMM